MKGIDYDIIEYFQYENKQQLNKELSLNQIGRIEYIPNERWIKQTINLKNCIRLRDLMLWIEKGLVLISLGQILRLCQNLLNKVIELQQNQLDHCYLTSNRIWLKLTQNSKLLTIAHVDIEYQIVFTGFQCPIFENQSNKQSASTSIIQIMIQIIKVFETNFHQFRYIQYLNQQIFHILYQQKDLYQAQNCIRQLYQIYKSHKNYNDYCTEFQEINEYRKQMEYGISKLFSTILHCFNCHEGFFKEDMILGLISIIGESIKQNTLKKLEEIDYQKMCENQEIFWNNKIKSLLTDNTLIIIRNQFQQIEEITRLEISQENEQMMIDQINREITKSYILKYFFNSIWIWTPNYQECKQQLIQNLMPKLKYLTKERVDLHIKEMAFQFINELI
ncbi:unnamed protein product [Paramecium pentaurelia]|uniref:Uncharacterized protein n=1 Tax=Paramecium pentaurelia TaxID=43138 RepID=A0A8S1W6E2_9CILI|nr:unnamed protein product [Paramecium pentaurelia]